MRIANVSNQEYIPAKDISQTAAQLPSEKKKNPGRESLLAEEQKLNIKELSDAVEKMERAVSIFNKHFKFRIHDETNRVIVQVIDNRTNEVVNEIPPEKILDLVADLQNMVGIVIDKKA